MPGEWLKICVILFCVNTMMYVGASVNGLELIEGDMLSQVIDTDFTQEQFLNESSGGNFNTTSTISVPERQYANRGLSNVLFLLDTLDVVYDTLITIFNFAFAPFILFQVEGIPYIIAFLMAPVLTLLFWLSLIQVIRGAS